METMVKGVLAIGVNFSGPDFGEFAAGKSELCSLLETDIFLFRGLYYYRGRYISFPLHQ